MSERDGAAPVPRTRTALWRSVLLRREIVSICTFIFVSDMIIGMIAPTLSLFARNLGASLTLVGVLAAILGVSRLFGSISIGALSDRRGRKTILMAGSSLMAAASLLYSLAPQPYFLLPTQVLLGLGFVSTLTIGIAYASDTVASVRERSLAVGLATTAMGFGYAVGSFAGGNIASTFGYRTNYLTTLVLALIGLVFAWRIVPRDQHHTTQAGGVEFSLREQLQVLVSDPVVFAIAIGGMINNFVFGGLIITFFPIYANGLGLTQAAIGTMFAIRALASTAARLPGGALGTIIPGHRLLLAALTVSMLVAFSVPQTSRPAVMLLVLIAEGVSYGIFMTVGQATVAGRAGDHSRGAALGIYMAAASIGDSVIPLILGAIADLFGVRSVFFVGGAFALLGLAVIARIFMRNPMQLAEET